MKQWWMVGSVLVGWAWQAASAGTLVQFSTLLGDLDVELLDQDKPVTVRNFLSYVEKGLYQNMFFHRLATNFVLQGGGFGAADPQSHTLFNTYVRVPNLGYITNEYNVGAHFSNAKGTLAMAKLANNPNSASSEWFFNLVDNGANLDFQNGGFTVFGRVVRGLEVLDKFNLLTPGSGIVDMTTWYGAAASAFSSLPVRYSGYTRPFFDELMYVQITPWRAQVRLVLGGAREITWNSVSNRLNFVDFTTNLPPVWQVLDARQGDGQALSVTDLSPAVNTRYYRVRVNY